MGMARQSTSRGLYLAYRNILFSTMTDNTDTYSFVGYTDSETLPGHQKICSVDKIPLANFLNEDQGYQTGISMYGHYIACK